MSERQLSGVRIGLFGKGGSGKSTMTVLLARGLSSLGYRPIILDADSTNIGLAQALGIDETPAALIDYFGGMVFTGGAVTCPVDDPTRIPTADIDLDHFPGRFQGVNEEGIRLLVGGKMGELGPGAGCDGPIAKIARDVRVRTEAADPILLVDFKAGFEDSARGVLTDLDWAVVVVDPTTASIHMAVHLNQMVRKIRSGVMPATAHLEDPALAELARHLFRSSKIRGVVAVLNRIPDTDAEVHLREQLSRLGGPKVIGVLPEIRAIQGQWLRGERVEGPGVEEEIRSIARALELLGAPEGTIA